MRIRILGAGIIGLSCADELIRRGHEVTVLDPAPGQGASRAAAGMISPAGEAWHGEDELFRLGLDSAAQWPSYAERLGVPLHRAGTLLVGRDRGDLQLVERQADLLARRGLRVDLLGSRASRALEPTLTSGVAGGAHLPDDLSVDPREIVSALLDRVPVLDPPPVVEPACPGPGRRVETTHDLTVLATGATLPAPFTSLVRGVRGEVVRATADDPPARTLRGRVHGEPLYVVPRRSGEVVIGATSEEHDAPPVATIGGVSRLLAAARELLPGLDRAELTEAMARDRPGTADNLPLVGPSGVERVLLAAGHFRHGVLLAPLTARLIADHVETGHVEPALDPRRFSHIHERSHS